MQFKKQYFVILLIVIVALAVSPLLLPGRQEIALMQMKDKHFEEARGTYEKQLAAGSLTLEVVNNLTDLYLQVGAVDKAIDTMKKFVDTHPDNIEARTKLGTLYQYAQRPDDYLHNLEEINKIKAKPEVLSTLSDIYNFKGEYDKQAQTLRDLIIAEQGKNADHFSQLANIQASRQDYGNAIATLRDLQKLHPEHFNFANETLLVSLLFDNKQPEEALKAAVEWNDKHDNPLEAAQLVNMVHFKGNAAMGNTLVARFSDDKINASPELLEAFILLQLSDGKDNEAYTRLRKLYDAKSLPPMLNNRLLILAAARGEQGFVHELMKITPFSTLSETQLVTLTDIAVAKNDRPLLAYVASGVQDENARRQYPALAAAVAVANHDRAADTLLANLDHAEVVHEQALGIADICARNRRFDCTEHFIAKLPDSSKLTDTEVASVGELYLLMHQWDKGYQYLHTDLQTRKSLLVEEAELQYLAAHGDEKAVVAWLDGHPEALNEHMLDDLFFAAYNNHQSVTAVRIGEVINRKYNNDVSRGMLASAYMQGRRYDMAVALLRGNRHMSESDQYNYLTALTKLAPHSKQYRAELVKYAGDKLRSGVSGKQKLAFVYALIDAHEEDVAMPYIHELALHSGGQWVALYAELLDKHGRHEEARAFWLEVARQPGTSLKEKDDIANVLLEHGYKDDAESLFREVAAHYGAGSTQVAQLVYVWGPRPSEEQMRWLEGRYTQSSGEEQGKWAVLISSLAVSDYMAGFVERHPESVNTPEVAEAYFEALAEKGKLSGKRDYYIADAKGSGDVKVLRKYADTASDHGLKSDARKSYEAIIQVTPADYVTMRQAGLSAYEEADYKTSKRYLGQYVKDFKGHDVKDEGAYSAFFYYAELLRKDNDIKAARPYYSQTLVLLSGVPETPANLAIKAQSQIWSGDVKGGLKTFDDASREYPENAELQGGMIGTLIDLKQYGKARASLKTLPQNASVKPATAMAIPSFSTPVRESVLLNGNRELLVRFTGPVSDADTKKLDHLPWVSYSSSGYDTLLIAALPGYAFRPAAGKVPAPLMNGTADMAALEVVADNVSPLSEAAKQDKLRYETLNARLDLETGHVYDATKRLNNLLPQYKGDPQLLGMLANAENYGGNWPRATQLLKKAHALAPENDDVSGLLHDIRRDHAQNVQFDYDWIHYGHSDEHIFGLQGFVDVQGGSHPGGEDSIQLGAGIQENYTLGRNVRLSNGQVGDFSGNREQGQVWGQWSTENGQRAKLAVYGNNDTAGLGGYYGFLNPLGQTDLSAEYQRPYWDMPEAVLDDATRDRIAFLHTVKPTTRLTIDGGAGWNRYNVREADDVSTSITADAAVVYRLYEEVPYRKPFINIGYSLDGEYVRNDKETVDATGALTRQLPLISREIHTPFVQVGYQFNPRTYGEVTGGYEYDRLGGNGPTVSGAITHELTPMFDMQLRASYGLDTTNTQNSLTDVGGYARLRF